MESDRDSGVTAGIFRDDGSGLRQRIFSELHSKNGWNGIQSLSGPGSDERGSAVIRETLPLILAKYGIRSILDAPCGDWNWMKDARVNLDFYIGIDIVPQVITRNVEKYGAEHRRFAVKDLVSDFLPRADMIICRDCLAHLPLADCLKAIKNFKNSCSEYLLVTTSPTIKKNLDVNVGEWRALNLQLSPFNFPEPLELINEKSIEKLDCDKNLGLWNLTSL